MSTPKVVVLGTGFGGLEAAFYLRQRVGRRAAISFVSNQDCFQFKPNTIYIPFGEDPDRYVIPLAGALRKRQIALTQAQVTGVDPTAQQVQTSSGPVPYDYLIIATGAAMNSGEIPGLSEHANTIWDPADMLRLRQSVTEIIAASSAGQKHKVLFVVPPNNKCAGPLYEIVLMLDTWLRRHQARDHVNIVYATYERGYIQAFGPRLHEVVTDEFKARDIAGFNQRTVSRVEKGVAYFEGDGHETYDLLVSFPPYVASVRYDSLPSDDRGFLKTNAETRQVQGHPGIYAVGDGGDFPVKQAFLAMLQADAAAEHIAERILGVEPKAAFDPVSMCIMEQLDKATFAQVPLHVTGDPQRPVEVREDRIDIYRVGSGSIWRAGKKMLGTVLPMRFRAGLPFHAGPTWNVMEAGLKVMSSAFAD